MDQWVAVVEVDREIRYVYSTLQDPRPWTVAPMWRYVASQVPVRFDSREQAMSKYLTAPVGRRLVLSLEEYEALVVMKVLSEI